MKHCLYLTLMIVAMISAMRSVKASAGTIGTDNAIGGVGYLLEHYEGDMSDVIAYNISVEEQEVLCRIVEAEVTGEGDAEYYEAKRNVASCVITRWLNGWGATITEVVFQPKQFSPIGDGRYWTVEITEQTRDAVTSVLRFERTHSSEYFCTRTCDSYRNGYHSTLHKDFSDCVHTYFSEKGGE